MIRIWCSTIKLTHGGVSQRYVYKRHIAKMIGQKKKKKTHNSYVLRSTRKMQFTAIRTAHDPAAVYGRWPNGRCRKKWPWPLTRARGMARCRVSLRLSKSGCWLASPGWRQQSRSPLPRLAPAQSESTYSDSNRLLQEVSRWDLFSVQLLHDSQADRWCVRHRTYVPQRWLMSSYSGRTQYVHISTCCTSHQTRCKCKKLRSDCKDMQRLTTPSFNPIARF